MVLGVRPSQRRVYPRFPREHPRSSAVGSSRDRRPRSSSRRSPGRSSRAGRERAEDAHGLAVPAQPLDGAAHLRVRGVAEEVAEEHVVAEADPPRPRLDAREADVARRELAQAGDEPARGPIPGAPEDERGLGPGRAGSAPGSMPAADGRITPLGTAPGAARGADGRGAPGSERRRPRRPAGRSRRTASRCPRRPRSPRRARRRRRAPPRGGCRSPRAARRPPSASPHGDRAHRVGRRGGRDDRRGREALAQEARALARRLRVGVDRPDLIRGEPAPRRRGSR